MEPVELIRAWCFLSLAIDILFGFTELTDTLVKLYEQWKGIKSTELKPKALGCYSVEDPLR